jgi:hypothetical protein
VTREEREEMERETARIQAFRGRVKIFRCACGNELETDLDLEVATHQACGRCGAKAWTQKRSKAVLSDPTAPEEMKGTGKRKKVEDEE